MNFIVQHVVCTAKCSFVQCCKFCCALLFEYEDKYIFEFMRSLVFFSCHLYSKVNVDKEKCRLKSFFVKERTSEELR